MGLIGLSNLSITGDCSNSNSGAFYLDFVGQSPDYYVVWIDPLISLSPIPLGAGVTAFTQTNLSGDSYAFKIVDSDLPPGELFVALNVSTGTCIGIDSITNTTCNTNNGSLTASTTNLYNGEANFYLYETNDGYITSANTATNTCTFSSLSAGTYYVIANDGGGCTGKSESCIIKSSTTFTYDLYVVDDANCAGSPAGAVYVTNINGGSAPYTYSWSNAATTASISGLSSGVYTVTVTDSTNCSVVNSAIVNQVPPVGLGSFVSISPSCFASDGQLEVNITGGTGPYYYSGSNGSSVITFSQSHIFTNLPSGTFSVQVTDSALCSFNASTILINPSGFSILSINTVGASCSNQSGAIQINLAGGAGTFQYSLIDSSGNTTSVVVASTNYTFNNLYPGTYTVQISGGTCVYSTAATVADNVPFIVNSKYTGTTCNQCDGAIEISVSGVSGIYKYNLVGIGQVTTSSTATTFTNLCPNTYQALVTNLSSRCTVPENILLPGNPTVQFSFFTTNPSSYINNGTISVLITSGTPPFTLTWSPNVNAQTGTNLINLSAGTYTLTVQDSEGCVFTNSVNLIGYIPFSNYQVYNICDSNFINNGELLTKGIKQMLLEGFYDLTSGDTNCILNNSYFTAIVSVEGVVKTNTFYTGTTLNDYPSNSLWSNTIEDLLTSYNGITGVTINIGDNKVKITTKCNTLSDADVIIDLLINYDISCEAIALTLSEPPD